MALRPSVPGILWVTVCVGWVACLSPNPVWKDPITGKWIEVTDELRARDPRLRDRRMASTLPPPKLPSETVENPRLKEDVKLSVTKRESTQQIPLQKSIRNSGDLLVDSFLKSLSKPTDEPKLEAQESIVPSMEEFIKSFPPSPFQTSFGSNQPVVTRDIRAKNPRFIQPAKENLAPMHLNTIEGVQVDQQLVGNNSSISETVDEFYHPALTKVNITVLTSTPLGNLCRFAGFQPITGCPPNVAGCTTPIPCTRKCAPAAYYSYRCISPIFVNAASLPPVLITPAVDTTSEQYIEQLAKNLQQADQAHDYAQLARLIATAVNPAS